MMLPFITKDGELEEYDIHVPTDYQKVPRLTAQSIVPGHSSYQELTDELFKKKDLSFSVRNKYCRVTVYVSMAYGHLVKTKEREGFISATLQEWAPLLFTYGERFTYQHPLEVKNV